MNIEEAYERYQSELTGYLHKTFGEDDIAQEAAQQAFSRAVFSLPYLDSMPDAALRAWLYATARNAATDMLRRRKRLAYDVDLDRMPGAQGIDLDDRQALLAAMRTLDDTRRSLVRMRHIEGYNASEIAALLGMTAVNVRYHLMNAMKQLRTELEEEEP